MIKQLCKIKLFRPKGLFHLLRSIRLTGSNLGVILRVGAKLYPKHTAITYENEKITYNQLYLRCNSFAYYLRKEYKIIPKQRIAIICHNHVEYIYALFTCSRLGADLFLLNPDYNNDQLNSLCNKHKFDFVIYDGQFSGIIEKNGYTSKSSIRVSDIKKVINNLPTDYVTLEKGGKSKIVVLTSGTTGIAKTAGRKLSAHSYFMPFLSLITKLNLHKYQSLYVATPIYHGFGLCSLLVALILGKQTYVSTKFDAKIASEQIANDNIEVVTVVPSMLQRILDYDYQKLNSLQCIISGGAALPSNLVEKAKQLKNDNILYNLYGSSEAGFCIIATPKDLNYSNRTIGKPLRGVKIQIGNNLTTNEKGELKVRCKWSVNQYKWIGTGDIGYKDDRGYFFLAGRTDDMIVSGGENVYPSELENILLKHPLVKESAVIGVHDSDFGQRLKAFVVLNESITEPELRKWIVKHCARFQVPREIVFIDELPITAIGKVNKKALELI